jgi:hypothetical protein
VTTTAVDVAKPVAYVVDETTMLWVYTPVPVGTAVAPLTSVALGLMVIASNAAMWPPVPP